MYEIIKMSLIFTSNTQDDYKDLDETGRQLNSRIGIENPADYHNHLTSPLEVKPNSQIAVQSVKISRNQIYEITDSTQMLYYHGEDLGTTKKLEDTTSRPTLISLPRGTYDRSEFATEIESQLNSACLPPAVFQNFKVNVSLVDNDFKGFEINASQHGTAFTDKNASLDTVISDISASIGSTPPSDNFTLAAGTFTRTGASGTILDGLCCGIGTDFPLAIGENACMTVDLFGASYYDAVLKKNLNSSWAIGLTRPTLQTNTDSSKGKNHGNAPLNFIKQNTISPHYYDYVAIFDAEDGSSASGILKLYQGCQEKDDEGALIPNSFKLHEIDYTGGAGQLASSITNASINASGEYHQLRWSFDGDEVRLSLLKNGGGTELMLIDSTQNASTIRVFKPMTDFTSALYPKICLSQGSVEITHYDTYSVATTDYVYPSLTGADPTTLVGGTYNVGSSPYANYVSRTSLVEDKNVSGQQPSWAQRGLAFIFPPDSTCRDQLLPFDRLSEEASTFVGVNASGGVAYKHTLILEDTTPPEHRDQEIGNYYSSMCDISRYIGFPDISVLDQSYGTVTHHNMITWESTDVPQFRVNSAFVRISNLNHRTYNSCKNSVSKMMYMIPRFTNDGKQFGDLFFEVSEKTYIDLNNTESFNLNQLQIQIVDKNERVVDDLHGDTIIVFHIKQK